MDTTNLTAGLPDPPRERELPGSARRRNELLALISAGPRHQPRWAVSLGAAAAVTAIAVAAILLVPIFGHRAPSGSSTGGHAPATAGGPAACTAPAGTECQSAHSYTMSAPLRALDVRTDVGSVTVTGSGRGSVSVTERLSYIGLPPVTSRSTASGTLTLGYTCRSTDCAVAYEIQVPRSMSVQVTTGVGSIWLTALSGQVSASSNTGDIYGRDLSGNVIGLGTQVGSIGASFTAPPARLTATSDTGAITLRVPTGTSYDVTAQSDVGAVSIGVPQAAASGHVIRASTSVGPVTVTTG